MNLLAFLANLIEYFKNEESSLNETIRNVKNINYLLEKLIVEA